MLTFYGPYFTEHVGLEEVFQNNEYIILYNL